MDKYIGKRLEGRYEIQELIGMGGMANVYKAQDVIDDRPVAVKILRDEFVGNTEFLRRFKNESKAIAVLSHPNIVRVYDVTFTSRVNSIIMEYIDGITLKDYIERQSVLTWKEAVHFTLQILRALQHAHDKGIVHRDIKPQNIMLLQNGTIKVTDFGIARFARSEVKTITDRAIGSVHYISPEQAMGDNTDEKADIYSVGVMLFEMLTGRLPFEADSPVSVALKQIQSQAVRPTSLNPDIPAGLEDITVRAMQKDAYKRYSSAAEMIADIEEFKRNPSIHFEYKYNDENDRAKDKKIKKAIDNTRKEEPMTSTRRRTPYIPILTGVTLAFVLAALAFVGLMFYYNNPFITVGEEDLPSFVGLKYETVIAQNDQFDIVLDEVDGRVYSNEWAKGIIIDQRPRAGQSVRLGSQVRVKVSLGPLIVTLPNFSGRESRETYSWIRENGLEYKEHKAYSEEIAAGSVIYTDPSKDAQLNAGTLVNVYVSMGPEQLPTEVPDVNGLRISDAQSALESKLLVVSSVLEQFSDYPEGVVIGQDPPAGSMVNDGSNIILTISKGPDPRTTQNRLPISVRLPDVDQELRVSVWVGEATAAYIVEMINPQDLRGRYWEPEIFTSEAGEVLVKVYVDRKLFDELIVEAEAPPPVRNNDDDDSAPDDDGIPFNILVDD